MSDLNALVLAINDLVARAVDAKVSSDGLPANPPVALPLVASEWERTTSNAQAFSTREGKQQTLSANHRTHEGRTYVLFSSSANPPYDVQWERIFAQKIIDAFRRDERLEDASGRKLVDALRLNSVEPFSFEWQQVVYYGVMSNWEALELV